MCWLAVTLLAVVALLATLWGWHQRTAAGQLHDAVVAFLGATSEPLTPEQVRSAITRLETTVAKIIG
jgi:hypothetical protein